MVLAFFLASAFAPNHPTKRPAILVMTVPTAQVLSVIMVASVNLDCRRDERRWGQGQGQGGRAQANNNSQDQNCGAHDGLRSLPESIAKLALWHCFYVEQAIVLHDSIPAATRIEICVHRPKFGEIGCWNCILKSSPPLRGFIMIMAYGKDTVLSILYLGTSKLPFLFELDHVSFDKVVSEISS
jgi:hypothetical protein